MEAALMPEQETGQYGVAGVSPIYRETGAPEVSEQPTVETEFGRFRLVDAGAEAIQDRWWFECPGCKQWAYLDSDQWHGRVSVDHAADGCPGGYHETHDFIAALRAHQGSNR